jgi:hypothetical protein
VHTATYQIADKPKLFEIANRFDESVVAVLGAIVQHAPVSMRATSVASFVFFQAD